MKGPKRNFLALHNRVEEKGKMKKEKEKNKAKQNTLKSKSEDIFASKAIFKFHRSKTDLPTVMVWNSMQTVFSALWPWYNTLERQINR